MATVNYQYTASMPKEDLLKEIERLKQEGWKLSFMEETEKGSSMYFANLYRSG